MSDPEVPWMTVSLVRCTYKKASLFRIACKSKCPDDLAKYKSFKNILTSVIRIAKNMYFANRIDECKVNLRKVCSVINEVLPRRKSQRSPSQYKNSGTSAINNESAASEFNTYFTTLPSVDIPGDQVLSNIPIAGISSFPSL